ncbi:right-handed parallel beta-helix repeat-containing protein [Fibrobacter sp.]|uniref:right-handed parallel beta-helix repeat-containing protein n=1 Tax=Fibrobacter sp. TaxID=35828 RepID=UPI00388F6346
MRLKKWNSRVFAFSLAFAAMQSFGAVYYVAPDGNDAGAGTKDKPFATLNKANAVVHAGDTVWVRGGIYDLRDTVFFERYRMTAAIVLTASGESDDNRIHYLAYPGERPIFDGANLPVAAGTDHSDGTPEGAMYTSPIVISAKYLHLKGFDVRNTPMKHNSNSGVFLYASKHIFLEQIDSHHNAGPGFFANDGAPDGGGHIFLNCDAHDNYDPTGWQGDGENADGFGAHYQKPGEGDTTKFIGCRAWWNSDDGFDFINQEFPVVLENCYAMGNGYSDYGLGNPKNGNGHGIKMGESTLGGGRHTIKFCAAWKNKATGFYANYTGAGSKWLNNTSYMNVDRAFSMASTLFDSEGNRLAEVAPLTGDNAHVLKNNIAFPNKNSQIGECWEKIESQGIDHYVECPAGENNTWNLNLDLTVDDFESLDDPSMTVTGKDLSTIAGILGPRNADGSLPNVGFLKLKKGSRAIDKGEDLGFPFVGEAPDLGAFEYGLSSSSVAGPSSSAGSSSSAESAASIAMPRNGYLPGLHATRGAALVFDLQGRLLGNLQFEQINGGDFADRDGIYRDAALAGMLRAKFRNPGTYIVRYGSEIRKVQVSP